MVESHTTTIFSCTTGQVREALDRLEGLVLDGLKHGFFEYYITCEIGNGGKRQLVIRAGRSHRFVIPDDELLRLRGLSSGDPCDGDAEDANHVEVQRHRWDSEAGDQGHGCGAEPAVRSSVQPSQVANVNLVGRTRQVWGAYIRLDLSREDARKITESVNNFFNILVGWSLAELRLPANDAGKPAASDRAGAP